MAEKNAKLLYNSNLQIMAKWFVLLEKYLCKFFTTAIGTALLTLAYLLK